LQTLERAWITNTQLEAARVALTRNMKRKGKLWIRVFPDKPVSARPPETRMGKGKGQPEFWVATVRPGNILFELDWHTGIGRARISAPRRRQTTCADEVFNTPSREGCLTT
jgi:ribosomal protein L16, bacterial/organelle